VTTGGTSADGTQLKRDQLIQISRLNCSENFVCKGKR